MLHYSLFIVYLAIGRSESNFMLNSILNLNVGTASQSTSVAAWTQLLWFAPKTIQLSGAFVRDLAETQNVQWSRGTCA